MNGMTIYIPTSGRPTRQVTLANIPNALLPMTKLVVPAREVESYAAAGIDKSRILPVSVDGIGKTRQWVIANAKSRYVLFLDDDMDFCYRPDMSSAKLVTLKPGDKNLDRMFQWCYDELEGGLVHVGISARQGNNHVEKETLDAKRMNNAYAYNVKALRKSGLRFDVLPLMEDFYVTLGLLVQGYANRVTYRWCWNQRGSNASGGCSGYRNAKMQTDAANRLKKAYPAFVKIIEKKSKAVWKGMEVRTDVRIQWQQALNQSRRPK